MMTVVVRNFFLLLRQGGLHEAVETEPMSPYKWRQVLSLARTQQVAPWVGAAILSQAAAGHDDIPRDVAAAATTAPAAVPAREETLPSLSNGLLNHRLDRLRHQERHAIDTSTETLQLLDLIVTGVNDMLGQDAFLPDIVRLGHYLHSKGDRIDFVKLETWLRKLRLSRMARLQGSMLVRLLGFSPDEIPFAGDIDPGATALVLHSLRQTTDTAAAEWHFRQSRSGLIHNNTAALLRNVRRRWRYFAYAPLETVSNFLAHLARSLSEIAE